MPESGFDLNITRSLRSGRTQLFRRSLGQRARCVEHIGSTPVPGSAAKPIIDMLLTVDAARPGSAAMTLTVAPSRTRSTIVSLSSRGQHRGWRR